MFFSQSPLFPPRPIFIIRVFLHMDRPQSLSLIYKRPLLLLHQWLPFCTQSFTNLWIMHFRVILCHFTTSTTWPNHKRIHWSFHSGLFLHIWFYPIHGQMGLSYHRFISIGVMQMTIYFINRWELIINNRLLRDLLEQSRGRYILL